MLFDLFDMTTGDSSEDGLGLCQGYANQNDCSLCAAPIVQRSEARQDTSISWTRCCWSTTLQFAAPAPNSNPSHGDVVECNAVQQLQSTQSTQFTCSLTLLLSCYCFPQAIRRLLRLGSFQDSRRGFYDLVLNSIEFRRWIPTMSVLHYVPLPFSPWFCSIHDYTILQLSVTRC